MIKRHRAVALAVVVAASVSLAINALPAVAAQVGVSHETIVKKPGSVRDYDAVPLPTLKRGNAARAASSAKKRIGAPGEVAPVSPVGGPGRLAAKATAAGAGVQEAYYPYDTTQNPARQVGRLFLTLGDGSMGHCTATLVAATNQSTLLTAAHCLYTYADGWIESAYFCPGFNSGRCPLGAWPVRLSVVEEPWFSWEDSAYDVGIALLEDRYLWKGTETKTVTTTESRHCRDFKDAINPWDTERRKRRLRRKFRRCQAKGPIVHEEVTQVPVTEWRAGTAQSVAGAHGMAWNYDYVQTYWAFGYPATNPDVPGVQYDPNYLTWCPQRQSAFVSDLFALVIRCGMTWGSSGGPWLMRTNQSGVGYVNSVNSFGLVGLDEYMFGPYFGNPERNLYQTYESQ